MADRFVSADAVPAGTTSVSLDFKLHAENTDAPVLGLLAAAVTCSYWRQGGLRVAIPTTDLAAVDSAYSAGGWKQVDSVNLPGLYRLDVPDAAFATGADWVVVGVSETGTQNIYNRIALPTFGNFANAIFAKVIETQGSITAQQALSIILAAVAGVTTSGGTVLKTPNGSATRIAATINGSNERTAMALTPSS